MVEIVTTDNVGRILYSVHQFFSLNRTLYSALATVTLDLRPQIPLPIIYTIWKFFSKILSFCRVSACDGRDGLTEGPSTVLNAARKEHL